MFSVSLAIGSDTPGLDTMVYLTQKCYLLKIHYFIILNIFVLLYKVV